MSNVAKYPIIGFSHYDSNGKKGFYLNLIEDYQARDGLVGSFPINMSAPHSEVKKMDNLPFPVSFTQPAIIEIVQSQQPFGRTVVTVCDEILSITPISALKPEPAQPAPSTQPAQNAEPAPPKTK
jgi:hypothetical protein